MFEGPRNTYNASEKITITDYSDEPYYHLLQQLPPQLAINHLKHIENENLSDPEAIEYLANIIDHRHEVMQVSEISDQKLAQEMIGHETALFDRLENWVRTNPDNYLGDGTTAVVKQCDIETQERNLTLAIKYVVSPNKMTLTAQAEHDVVSEVERLRVVETAESAFAKRSKFIRVPHPYLHHKNENIQLYGMEKVDGITLQQVLDGYMSADFKEQLQHSQLADIPLAEIEGYIQRFFDTMHEYCLHGDIKPRNIMVNSAGVFYIIDFGQSRLAHTVPDEAQEQFDNLKADEIKLATSLIKQLITKVRKTDSEIVT